MSEPYRILDLVKSLSDAELRTFYRINQEIEPEHYEGKLKILYKLVKVYPYPCDQIDIFLKNEMAERFMKQV